MIDTKDLIDALTEQRDQALNAAAMAIAANKGLARALEESKAALEAAKKTIEELSSVARGAGSE